MPSHSPPRTTLMSCMIHEIRSGWHGNGSIRFHRRFARNSLSRWLSTPTPRVHFFIILAAGDLRSVIHSRFFVAAYTPSDHNTRRRGEIRCSVNDIGRCFPRRVSDSVLWLLATALSWSNHAHSVIEWQWSQNEVCWLRGADVTLPVRIQSSPIATFQSTHALRGSVTWSSFAHKLLGCPAES